MQSNHRPPLAGQPPLATDAPDSHNVGSPVHPDRRPRPPGQTQQTRPTSAYDVYDNYVNDSSEQNRESGFNAVGSGFLNGDADDESDDETIAAHAEPKKVLDEKMPPPSSSPDSFPAVPIVAPKPGYAAPVSAISLPEPAATPVGVQRGVPQMAQVRRGAPMPVIRLPLRMGYPARGAVPNTPHPLQPPMTPITPAFARPPKEDSGVKFEKAHIIRGKDEEVPLARRGQKGDEFWRRFSMVVKNEDSKSTSSWLRKTQSGAANMSRMVWCVGILLIMIIAGAIGVGLYISHNSKTTTMPKALGGSAGEGVSLITTFTTSHKPTTSSTPHVSPTNTVAKRWPGSEPSPFLANEMSGQPRQLNYANLSSRHQRKKAKRRVH